MERVTSKYCLVSVPVEGIRSQRISWIGRALYFIQVRGFIIMQSVREYLIYHGEGENTIEILIANKSSETSSATRITAFGPLRPVYRHIFFPACQYFCKFLDLWNNICFGRGLSFLLNTRSFHFSLYSLIFLLKL